MQRRRVAICMVSLLYLNYRGPLLDAAEKIIHPNTIQPSSEI